LCASHCLYRYLKRIFRELFERQGFVRDGLFDWEVKKRQELAAKAERAGSAEEAHALSSAAEGSSQRVAGTTEALSAVEIIHGSAGGGVASAQSRAADATEDVVSGTVWRAGRVGKA
jgi:hypothetical protein